MIKRVALYFFVTVVSVFAIGCQNIMQYALSEQMVNHYLQSAMNKNVQQFNISDFAKLDLSFKDLDADIGRDDTNSVMLSGTVNTKISTLLGSQDAALNLQIKGRPDFDQKNGAVYIKDLELVSYKLESSLGSINTSTFIPYLNQALQIYFNQNPVYVLDKSNTLEMLALKSTSHFYVEKGQLVFSLL